MRHGLWIAPLFALVALPLHAGPPPEPPPVVESAGVVGGKVLVDTLAAELDQTLRQADVPGTTPEQLFHYLSAFQRRATAVRTESSELFQTLSQPEREVLTAYFRSRIEANFSRLAALVTQVQAKAKLEDPLVDDLVEARAVAWSAREQRVAFCDRWDQEGTGSGAQVVLARNSKEADLLPLYQPEDQSASQELQAHLPAVIQRMHAGRYVAMTRLAWTGKKPLGLPGTPWTLRWQGRRLWGLRAKQKPVELLLVTVEDVWKIRPLAVDFLPGAPVIAVTLDHDPGKLYVEGLNHVVSHEPVWLPNSVTPATK